MEDRRKSDSDSRGINLDRRATIAGVAASGLAAFSPASKAAPQRKTSFKNSKGLIAVEETCIPNAVAAEYQEVLGRPYPPGMLEKLTDFTGRRIEEMDACGIDIALLAATVPSPQYVPDPSKAAAMAKRSNDALAQEVAKRPDRFIGFAGLSMHDVDQACQELERCVTDLGMRGVLLYNFQRTADENGALFYDDRRFDPFWAKLEELDVPLYLHPGIVPHDAAGRDRDFAGFPWLIDAAWGFAVTTGLHVLRIITSGVFDRYPRVNLMIGHNGEHIVSDLWRIDNRLKNWSRGALAQRSVRDYFRTNIFVSTSGEFSTPALHHIIAEIGADRIMFAVDYPFEDNKIATDWFKTVDLAPGIWEAIGRDNIARLLKLV